RADRLERVGWQKIGILIEVFQRALVDLTQIADMGVAPCLFPSAVPKLRQTDASVSDDLDGLFSKRLEHRIGARRRFLVLNLDELRDDVLGRDGGECLLHQVHDGYRSGVSAGNEWRMCRMR